MYKTGLLPNIHLYLSASSMNRVHFHCNLCSDRKMSKQTSSLSQFAKMLTTLTSHFQVGGTNGKLYPGIRTEENHYPTSIEGKKHCLRAACETECSITVHPYGIVLGCQKQYIFISVAFRERVLEAILTSNYSLKPRTKGLITVPSWEPCVVSKSCTC